MPKGATDAVEYARGTCHRICRNVSTAWATTSLPLLVIVAKSPKRKQEEGIVLGPKCGLNVNDRNAKRPYKRRYLLSLSFEHRRTVTVSLPAWQVDEVQGAAPATRRGLRHRQGAAQHFVSRAFRQRLCIVLLVESIHAVNLLSQVPQLDHTQRPLDECVFLRR